MLVMHRCKEDLPSEPSLRGAFRQFMELMRALPFSRDGVFQDGSCLFPDSATYRRIA